MPRQQPDPLDSMPDLSPRDLLLTRRRFAQLLGGLSVMGAVDPLLALQVADPDPKRLSWRAFRTAAGEGDWDVARVEGRIPPELDGTLYRVGPGQRETFGVRLRHFFDGDAIITGFDFRDGRARLKARYVATPERERELKEGRMIYGEFGTLAPPAPASAAPAAGEGDAAGARKNPPPGLIMKNQPSVNVIPWDGRLLGLSEGGHPSAIDPQTFAFQGYWDFHGTLPANVPMTAHPKFDPATGEGLMYGVRQGFPPAIMVYKMELDGRLTRLWEIPVQSYLMIHDMILTKDHIVFVIPPVKLNPMEVLSGKKSLGEALRYFETEPLKLMILRRDGTGSPVTIEQPPAIVFHNGNGFGSDGRLTLDTMLAPDGSVLKTIQSWSEEKPPEPAQGAFVRLELDLNAGKLLGRTEINQDQDFPRFDMRLTGAEARYLYTAESGDSADAFAFTHVVKNDMRAGRDLRIAAGAGRAFGEPVFAPRPGGSAEDDGWLFIQGFDGPTDQTYLEIRDAATMELQARLWPGARVPLGFHGNFVPGSRLSA